MKILFWTSLVVLAYSYFLYPLVLLVLPKRTLPRATRNPFSPKLSIIITAYNEEARIKTKLKNTLASLYPRELSEIIVASDASTDQTDEKVKRYEQHGARLLRSQTRRGKEYAQSLAIQASTGEILIFTDVGTTVSPDAVALMVARFADPAVGAVSSEDRLLARDDSPAGEGIYVRYEMWLRSLESSVNSLVGLSGSFFAARREVCEDWDTQSPSDFFIALNCVRLGYVAVSEPRAVGYYQDVADKLKEYRRKVRTVIRGLSGVLRHQAVLNPFTYGLFAFQVWSHKVMRWLVPWFLLLLFISSVAVAGTHVFYLSVAVAQAAFYVTAVIGMSSKKLRTHGLLGIPFFFVQVNAAIAHATLAFIFGKRVLAWEPSKR